MAVSSAPRLLFVLLLPLRVCVDFVLAYLCLSLPLFPLSLRWMKSPTSVRAIRYFAALKELGELAGLRLGTDSG